MHNSVFLVFPGQGSQYVGMVRGLESNDKDDFLERADEILGYRLSKIINEGPEDLLKLTRNAQPAILLHSMIIFNKLKRFLNTYDKNVVIEMVLGHSLGEYSALTAAGALTFEEAIKIVHLRGKFMQEAVAENLGEMHAILKVSAEEVKSACFQASRDGAIVVPANYNSDDQTVISGDKIGCQRAIEWLKKNVQGSFLVKKLNVSGPFHSAYMRPAADLLEKALEKITFQQNKIPYVANVDAKRYPVDTAPSIIKNNLLKQVTNSVLWYQSVQGAQLNGLCLEVGPGKVLTGLVKRINPTIETLPLDSNNAFELLGEMIAC